ncbi:hypothetical protein DIURU_002441 [Diutina rugosa]|uniref:Uncharacterized protein n=1 Tax=Diutina rugosa TaxID=5481 RepID=A0A642UX32_DIURU|nr:uncharacterized protein DIURU_002441 [Diutina rugosa]KAA8903555.1 hypothetical protein DIURU_002441 [Diutina rugosa]
MGKPGHQRSSARPRLEKPVTLQQWSSGSHDSPPHDALSFISSSDSDLRTSKDGNPRNAVDKISSTFFDQQSEHSPKLDPENKRWPEDKILAPQLNSSHLVKLCRQIDQLKVQMEGCTEVNQLVKELMTKVQDHEYILQTLRKELKSFETESIGSAQRLSSIKKELLHLVDLIHRTEDTILSKRSTQLKTAKSDRITQAGVPPRKDITNVTTRLSSSVETSGATSVDLSSYRLADIADMPKLFPNLLSLAIDNNQLTSLNDVNEGIILLSAANNKIRSESFAKFTRISRLNLSTNELSIVPLNLSATLTFANFAFNKITSLDGLQHCWSLHHLDCSHNDLGGTLDLSEFILPRLEVLILGNNKITSVLGLRRFPRVRQLCLEDNKLETLEIDIPFLKKLNLSSNRLERIVINKCKRLEKALMDHNSLAYTKFPSHVRSLSLQHQVHDSIVETTLHQTPILEKLILAGVGHTNYSPLIYLRTLTITKCHFKVLPSTFSTNFPNLVNLFLDDNKLEGIDSLNGLIRMRVVSLVKNRLKWSSIASALATSAANLVDLDFRDNPACFEVLPSNPNLFSSQVSRQESSEQYDGQSILQAKLAPSIKAQFPRLRRINGEFLVN